MKVVKVGPRHWATLSKKAHLVVFDEIMPVGRERIDFALIAEDAQGKPMSYSTCREQDSESLYLQYGGSFPGTKGTGRTNDTFQGFLDYIKSCGYKRVSFYVDNKNKPMLGLAAKKDFLITGVRNYKGSILLEHLLEWK